MNLAERLGTMGDAGSPRAGLVALTDVVFLLMIFFLFGHFRLGEATLAADLAGGGGTGAGGGPTETYWITVRAEGGRLSYQLNDRAVRADPGAVVAELARLVAPSRRSGVRIVVDPAVGTLFRDLVPVWDACLQNGFRQVALKGAPPE